MNRAAPYAEELQFDISKEPKYDTDIVMSVDEMVEQAAKKINDLADERKDND
ncbi:hypothetical protein [Alkalibacillus silvisoli]